MARKNKLGTPYLGLKGLDAAEVKAIKQYLGPRGKGISAKHWLRYLIRKELAELGLSKTKPRL